MASAFPIPSWRASLMSSSGNSAMTFSMAATVSSWLWPSTNRISMSGAKRGMRSTAGRMLPASLRAGTTTVTDGDSGRGWPRGLATA